MIMQHIQNLAGSVYRLHGATEAPVYLVPGSDVGPLARIFRSLRELIVTLDRKRRVAYENRKAIAHLRSLSDAQLRDIGIGWHEIEYRVRAGNSSF